MSYIVHEDSLKIFKYMKDGHPSVPQNDLDKILGMPAYRVGKACIRLEKLGKIRRVKKEVRNFSTYDLFLVEPQSNATPQAQQSHSTS